MTEQLVHEEHTDLIGHSEAVFNTAGTHRYLLIRRWAKGGTTLTMLMLNPSTATATQDDPTIRRCVALAKREGCSALTVVNLFGLRSPHPAHLRHHRDAVGERNDEFIDQHCLPGRLVIGAWGAWGWLHDRAPEVIGRLDRAGVELRCLGTTRGGQPRHPLYLAGDTPLVRYAREVTAA
ncbi:MAG: hypothetical protein JWO67_2265 [Streptosporangiaceae bacterium]|nr:hypothetical protein [Streptosporangiaceae bacterium]